MAKPASEMTPGMITTESVYAADMKKAAEEAKVRKDKHAEEGAANPVRDADHVEGEEKDIAALETLAEQGGGSAAEDDEDEEAGKATTPHYGDEGDKPLDKMSDHEEVDTKAMIKTKSELRLAQIKDRLERTSSHLPFPARRHALRAVILCLCANAFFYFVAAWVWITDEPDPPGETPVAGAFGLAFCAWSLVSAWFENRSYDSYKQTDRSTVLVSSTILHLIVGVTILAQTADGSQENVGGTVMHLLFFLAFGIATFAYTTDRTPHARHGETMSPWKDGKFNGSQAALSGLIAVQAIVLFISGCFAFGGLGWNDGNKDTKVGAANFAWAAYGAFCFVAPTRNREHSLFAILMVHTLETCVGVFKNAEQDTHQGAIVLHFLYSVAYAIVIVIDLMAQKNEPARQNPHDILVAELAAEVRAKEEAEAAVRAAEEGDAEAADDEADDEVTAAVLAASGEVVTGEKGKRGSTVTVSGIDTGVTDSDRGLYEDRVDDV